MKSRDHIHLLTSCPKANGFYKAGRVKKYIPGIYRVNELNMLQKWQGLASRPDDFAIFEYCKGDWTFHGKGAWVYEDRSTNKVDMTVIGSSNFSYRSNRRDTECQLYIVPECEELKTRLHNEA
jgi:CDP-diacylglycerol---glycerol-3-phosphate 3-phosphatidyltransferase